MERNNHKEGKKQEPRGDHPEEKLQATKRGRARRSTTRQPNGGTRRRQKVEPQADGKDPKGQIKPTKDTREM